jgi:hypothetical protein
VKHVRSQPRIPGVKREPSHTSLLPEINAELRRLASKYGVTPSWVRASILADALKIRRQPKYYMQEVRRRKRA